MLPVAIPGDGVLKSMFYGYSRETPSLILMKFQITNICSVMKQAEVINEDLTQEHKKTTNRTTMVPTIDIDSKAPTIRKRLCMEPSEDRRFAV